MMFTHESSKKFVQESQAKSQTDGCEFILIFDTIITEERHNQDMEPFQLILKKVC